MKIDVYSHGFSVTELNTAQEKKALEQFCTPLILFEEKTFEGGITRMVPSKTFAASNAARDYYRFHVNLLREFQQMVAYCQIKRDDVQITRHPVVIDDSFRVEFIENKLHPPRDYQEEIIEYNLAAGSNKVITLQAGGGKTLLAQHTMKRLGYRTSIMMKGGYLDQWVSSLDMAFKFGRGGLVKIQGSIALHTIMQMAIDGDELPMCMLISINTFSEYIREYERNGVSQMYPIAPHEFFEVMKIGLNIFDEGHQFPHQVMKLFVYTHIEKFMTLSATLETRNKFMNRIYEIMYPRCDRFDAGYRKVYISASAVFWQLKDSKSIRYTGYKGAYSHVKFEESMMLSKNRKILANYVDMICAFAESEFISVMEKGQKMLIFCATVKFCTMLVKEIQKRYPHMDTTRYVSADKRTVMDKADIIVSTVLSAGTAVDIPNLRVTWMTTAIDSQQANEQALYRTRPLVDWPDQIPRFIYSVCSTIPKHVAYHLNKVTAWKLLVKEHGRMQSPISV